MTQQKKYVVEAPIFSMEFSSPEGFDIDGVYFTPFRNCYELYKERAKKNKHIATGMIRITFDSDVSTCEKAIEKL